MKIKALSTFLGDTGMIRRNAEVTVSEAYGKELIKRGRAVAVEAADEPEKSAEAKAGSKPKTQKSTRGAEAPEGE